MENSSRDSERYCDAPDEFLGGNRLALLRDGREAFPAMLSAIASAKASVHLETYILKSDDVGWAFARALASRARAGASVRLVYDSIGSMGLEERYLQFLRNNGVAFLEYRPVAPWRGRWALSRRDHRKILVVDAKTAFTGGLNIADDYADPAQGGGGWRDYHVRIEGKAAYEMDRLFRIVWYKETGRWFSIAGNPDSGAGPSRLRVAANQEFLHRHRIRKSYLYAIRAARRAVLIANAYFIPDRGIRHALYAARRRGVDVRILLPRDSDVALATYASRRLFDSHLRHGLRLYALGGPTLHAKAVVVDETWSAVGSYNMDNRSLLHNLEVNLHVLDGGFAAALGAALKSDLAQAAEITRDAWRRRARLERFLEGLCYGLRYWL